MITITTYVKKCFTFGKTIISGKCIRDENKVLGWVHILKHIQIKHLSPLYKINAFPNIISTRFYHLKRFFLNILTYFATFGFEINTFSKLAILPIRVNWHSGYYSWFKL